MALFMYEYKGKRTLGVLCDSFLSYAYLVNLSSEG